MITRKIRTAAGHNPPTRMRSGAIRAIPIFCLALLGLLLAGGITPAHAAMQDMPVIKLQSIDKITGRTLTFEARVGSTVKYGPLYIKVQACRKAPPIEQPESAAFLQIWEVSPRQKTAPAPKEQSKWVFSGWMFASSPALSAMDHPIYDVWVLDCMEQKTADAEAERRKVEEEKAKEGTTTEERLEAPVEDLGD
ncbi:MAG TPA: DUF2155 domain-containing protein [Micavibrio sp.]